MSEFEYEDSHQEDDEIEEVSNDELRQEFIDQIKVYVRYWEKLSDQTSSEKLEGLAFSILVMLDGESSLPPFAVRPIDENGKEGDDIGGALHELFFSKDTK